MNVANSELSSLAEGSFISNIGTYYFFDGFIISEINQGVVFTWEDSLELLSIARDYYGENLPICYISNRINRYAVKPTDWLKFNRNNRLNGYCIVTYNEQGWVNALIEKLFVRSRMQRFKNLYEAVEWVKKINEEKKKQDYLSAI